MTFNVSPQINVFDEEEVSHLGSVTKTKTIGAQAGYARWGAAFIPLALKGGYGEMESVLFTPDENTILSWLISKDFLQYSDNLKFVRVVGPLARNSHSPFVFGALKVRMHVAGSSIATFDSVALNMTVDWGDGSPLQTYTGTTLTHAYTQTSLESEFVMNVTGTSSSVSIACPAMVEVLDFGTTINNPQFQSAALTKVPTILAPQITVTDAMFYGCTIFNQDISTWDMSNVTSMAGMFLFARTFNQPIGSWNVSKVTDIGAMFLGAWAFNQPIGSWNVSNVRSMVATFLDALAFNQPIGSWNVSNVSDMHTMFMNARAFNEPIGSWNVSNVTNMYGMFTDARLFNQPIGSWNVSKVTDMHEMLLDAHAFNQNINSWNTISVLDMSNMFDTALAFNQPIGSWNVSNVLNMKEMFANAPVFNQALAVWVVSSVTNMIEMFTGALAFDQNISHWCVTNITTEPLYFSFLAPLTAPHKPIWGTCPV